MSRQALVVVVTTCIHVVINQYYWLVGVMEYSRREQCKILCEHLKGRRVILLGISL